MKKLLVITVGLFAITLLSRCTKDKKPSRTSLVNNTETDSMLLIKAMSSSGFSYYRNDTAFLQSSSQSGHTAYFRVRFNEIAQSALTDNGKLPTGGTFPAGSLIVKELQGNSSGTNLKGFAIMEKLPDDSNAADRWVWAEYTTTSAPPKGVLLNGKGNECRSCHSTNDRDKIRVFNLFP